ncbi:acetate CoA-transferase subunit alpha [Providencia burhodogranariea]|uniref:Acetyl-CoA:acetoacetyl-CoA transferase subunit alpha n=1 Tax=Providencia burhodogranariea DSM 19968 TaxID=1141662 RepID=K8WDZ6_9GAMM|nr:acetate CoA-transferase subunit alpha [Providencia burhodogranariea]EKT54420.1 acetyl-CoA:acetoacetyl-CoA transferase subunit alpha [Providencia burhodogranariea DSM 19968]
MKHKLIEKDKIMSHFRDGMSLMYGGFMGQGTPPTLVKMILDSGVKNLTLIGNDTGKPGVGVAPLVEAGRVSRLISSHIGLLPETGRQMIAGEMAVELVPQGTLVERIRSGGAGLGGFLTPTGVGTIVEEGKQRINIDGRDYLLELPLRADLAIIHAHTGDKAGNLYYRLASRNFNPLIALAADTVFAEVEQLVDVGELKPDAIMTPGMLVTGLFQGDR